MYKDLKKMSRKSFQQTVEYNKELFSWSKIVTIKQMSKKFLFKMASEGRFKKVWFELIENQKLPMKFIKKYKKQLLKHSALLSKKQKLSDEFYHRKYR